MYTILLGDCLTVMRDMADNSVDTVVTDPPYYKAKGEAWDRQWDTPAKFLAWLDVCVEQWARLLKPNGSLYCFASPKMAARVEVLIGARLNVLNRIIWRKHDGTQNEGGLWSRANKDILRRYFEQVEHVIFAEHYGADNIAKGPIGDHFFQPIQIWMNKQRGFLSTQEISERSGIPTTQVSHYFRRDANGWRIPNQDTINALRRAISFSLTERDLRKWYEDLRREYEDLRRPFSVTPDVPYTDVWDFKTVAHYPGKHPCEKPVALMEHIIATSTRPGTVVLDCFAGSGSTGIACVNLGRNFIGIEKDPQWVSIAHTRIEAAENCMQLPLVEVGA